MLGKPPSRTLPPSSPAWAAAPGRCPPEVVRGHGEGDRASHPVLRAAAFRGDEGRHAFNEVRDEIWEELLAILVDNTTAMMYRSFTVVGDRAQARHGFPESWPERLERVGLTRVFIAGLNIKYRRPEEVIAPAEPVIRAVLPDANAPTSIRSSGILVVHGSTYRNWRRGSSLTWWFSLTRRASARALKAPWTGTSR